jgi:hypothetical protein
MVTQHAYATGQLPPTGVDLAHLFQANAPLQQHLGVLEFAHRAEQLVDGEGAGRRPGALVGEFVQVGDLGSVTDRAEGGEITHAVVRCQLQRGRRLGQPVQALVDEIGVGAVGRDRRRHSCAHMLRIGLNPADLRRKRPGR